MQDESAVSQNSMAQMTGDQNLNMNENSENSVPEQSQISDKPMLSQSVSMMTESEILQPAPL